MGQEKSFENRIKEFLTDQKCWYVKYWGGGEYTKAGIPDVLTCVAGHFVGIEVKAPKGRPSILQIRNLKKIHDAGGVALLLYPKDFEIFKNLVEQMKCGNDKEISVAYRYLQDVWWSWYEKFRREGWLM